LTGKAYRFTCRRVEREKMLNVRITDDENRMLKALAEHQGMSVSDVIRQYVRRAFAETFSPKRAKR